MEFESRVDAALARKEIDIQDGMNLAVGDYFVGQRLYPNNHMILWDSVGTPTPHEGFEVKRKKISHRLSPPQPIHLEHKIKLSGNSPVGDACYDVLVDVRFCQSHVDFIDALIESQGKDFKLALGEQSALIHILIQP
nr:hypothetical protein [Tanacetum cinerariifolium]